MYKFLTLLGMLLLTLQSGCYPSFPSSTVCDFGKPMLGVVANDQLIVVDVDIYAYADVRENVHVGDKLLTVRPAVTVPGISPESIPFTNRDIVANTLIGRYTIPPTCYTRGQILPLVIQVEREGQIIDIDITWTDNVSQPTPIPSQTAFQLSPLISPQPTPTAIPLPTPTPMPSDLLYF